MNKLTDRCCSRCLDSEFERCPKVTECLTKRPLPECHDDQQCIEKREAIIRKICYGNGVLLKLTACSYTPDVDIGNIVNTIFMELRRRDLSQVSLAITGGLGNFSEAPFLSVSSPQAPTIVYANVDAAMISEIISQHIEQNTVVEKWVLGQFSDDSKKLLDSVPVIQYLDFFRAQNLRVSRRCGVIDPESLDEFFLEEGFLALSKALNRMSPDEVANLAGVAGLRERGDSGELVIKKWMRMVASDEEFQRRSVEERPPKYLICNAHEGYDASITDRNLIESDPFALIEGMVITAYAVQATEGIIYVNPTYELGLQRLESALALARENNYLGHDILGTLFSFDIEIRRAPFGYLVGEATSIISFLEGDIGTRPIPPYLEESGLWGCPTLIHNVETFLNIPLLVQHDFSWFTSTGTTDNPGTKCLTLLGAIKHPGIVEVPLGTPLREIIMEIGGGEFIDRPIKALHIGGPAGGYLSPESLDTPFDHDALQQMGLQVGTGTIEVLDRSVCLVGRIHQHFLATLEELCGQCTSGREGIYQISSILQAICEGRDIPGCRRRNFDDVQQMLQELADYIQQTSLCGFCSNACFSLTSVMVYFRKEFEDHVQRRCQAGTCF
ncbi:hypothetical protein CSA56_01535 [candidate division KSB3 bacterium]|uniref:NADH-ubiquinone oxidoreductase 51kDa subunit iron-sulphur binding domain-containing protein n=1 Tax=candidate division KSB3 bacterium TaxID=2044937 RepID=A0A2G6KK71_9BACT|nr:MAG: hypothetical protein CSA56_01535 [candidate division KSB3 bacterium]